MNNLITSVYFFIDTNWPVIGPIFLIVLLGYLVLAGLFSIMIEQIFDK